MKEEVYDFLTIESETRRISMGELVREILDCSYAQFVAKHTITDMNSESNQNSEINGG